MNKCRVTIIAAFLTTFLYSGCQNGPDSAPGTNKDSLYSGKKFNEHIRSTEALSPEDERQGFKLPEGFEINLFASEPDIGKPINFAFDAKGRMWVTQSFEYPFPAKGQGKDRVTILEDTDGDGRADKFTQFNDTLNIPIGVMPINDGAMVYSIPNVYKYADANKDGKPESGKKIMGPFETKDTHGMVNNFTWGFDGWIHACHGYANRSTVAAGDGDSVRLISGNTIRFRPDGSRVEITTEGRINPFGLVFDEWGYLYSTDCHTSPLYQLMRGGEYSQWGKQEKIGFAPDMKPFENEATALAGIAYYGDELFPEAFRKNLFIGDAVSSRVYRNSIVWKESTPVGKKEEDFVLSADPWFRPVDVKMGPDGAIYIADFYNSIIGHYEVPLDHPKRDRIRGRIWRITYNGKANKNIDFSSAKVEELIAALKSANISARMAATNQLANQPADVVAPAIKSALAKQGITANEYVHGLWVMQRVNALDDEMIRSAATNADPYIRVHAMRAIIEQKDTSAALFAVVQNTLNDKNPHVRRAAVDAMGRYVSPETIEKLIALRKTVPEEDTHMAYAIKLRMRDVLARPSLMQQVVQRKWSNEDARILSTAMVGVETPASGMFMYNYAKNNELNEKDLPRSMKHIMRFVPASEMDQVIALGKQKAEKNNTAEYKIFTNLRDGLASRGVNETPAFKNWGKDLAARLIKKNEAGSSRASDQNAEELMFATEAAGNYKVTEAQPVLIDILKDSAIRQHIRSSALRSLMKIDPAANAKVAGQLLQGNTGDAAFRRDIVYVLSEFPGKNVNRVLADVKNAPPDLQQGIVIALAGSDDGRALLFNKVKQGEIFARTLTEPRVEERLMMNITPAQKKMFTELTANLEAVDQEKQQVISGRIADFNNLANKPDPQSGQTVFVKNCSPCHSIKGSGGAIGPQLDGVGKWGVAPLVEKILDPNRNISENFRNYTVKTRDGKILSGLYRRDEGQVIIFANAAGQEFAVSKQDIVERKASKFSLMPDQFRNTIPVEEFNSLIAYLLSQK